MIAALLGVACIVDALCIAHCVRVLTEHANSDWHGRFTLYRLIALLGTVVLAGVVLYCVGWQGTGLLVASAPPLFGAGIVGFVLLVQIFFGGRPN